MKGTEYFVSLKTSVVLTEENNVVVNSEELLGRCQLKCDGTRAETRFRLSAKRTSPFKSAGASVQSTTGSRGSNAGYTMFRDSVKGTGYPHHSPVSPSLPLLCVTVCHHISTGLYHRRPDAKGEVPHKPMSLQFPPCIETNTAVTRSGTVKFWA